MKKFWNLVILVLAAALAYQLYQGGKLNDLKKSVMSLMMPTNTHLGPVETATVAPAATQQSEVVEESSAPEPATSPAPVFASAPETSATPVAAVAVATPTPRPTEIDLGTLDRRLWPRQIKLNKATQFSIVGPNNKLVGQVDAPAGVLVKLMEVRGAKLVVTMLTGSAPTAVDPSDTDLQERLREITKVAGSSTTETVNSPTATTTNAAATPWQPKLNDRGRTPFQRH